MLVIICLGLIVFVSVPYIDRFRRLQAIKAKLPKLIETMRSAPCRTAQVRAAIRVYRAARKLGHEGKEARELALRTICQCATKYCVVHIIENNVVVDMLLNPDRKATSTNVLKIKI